MWFPTLTQLPSLLAMPKVLGTLACHWGKVWQRPSLEMSDVRDLFVVTLLSSRFSSELSELFVPWIITADTFLTLMHSHVSSFPEEQFSDSGTHLPVGSVKLCDFPCPVSSLVHVDPDTMTGILQNRVVLCCHTR